MVVVVVAAGAGAVVVAGAPCRDAAVALGGGVVRERGLEGVGRAR
jgi:hypothetical protein